MPFLILLNKALFKKNNFLFFPPFLRLSYCILILLHFISLYLFYFLHHFLFLHESSSLAFLRIFFSCIFFATCPNYCFLYVLKISLLTSDREYRLWKYMSFLF